jgi:hypothetical protein
MRVAAAGGQPDLVAAPDSASGTPYRFPDLLPDGRTVLFTQLEQAGPSLAIASLADGRVRPLEQAGMSPRYVDGGILAFTQSDGTVFAAPFDAGRAQLTGPPQPIAENVRIGPAQVAKLGMARTGALAYYTGGATSRQLVIADRQGRIGVLPASPNRYRQPRFSPEGRRIAVGIDGSGPNSGDVWVYDLDARNLARLTFDSVSSYPSWMPDGQRVAFSHLSATSNFLSAIATDGSGTPETLLVRPQSIFEAEFTADGRTLVFRETHSETSRDIWMAPADSVEAAVPLIRTPFNERQIALTPDGRWLAVVSNETERRGVLEATAQEPAVAHVRRAAWPMMGRGRRELFFWSRDSLVMPVEAGAAAPREPRAVLVGRFQARRPTSCTTSRAMATASSWSSPSPRAEGGERCT